MTAARSLSEPAPAWPTTAAANDTGALAVVRARWEGAAGPFVTEGATADVIHDSTLPLAGPERLGATQPDADAQIVKRLHAWAPDGNEYPGDLWADILDYRALRMRELAGMHLAGAQAGRIATLERRLVADDRGGARQFERYRCRANVAIAIASGAPVGHRGAAPRIAVGLADLSAGGARLETPRAGALAEGAEIELWIEDSGGPSGVALPARVIWQRAGALGVMFAGAPRQMGRP